SKCQRAFLRRFVRQVKSEVAHSLSIVRLGSLHSSSERATEWRHLMTALTALRRPAWNPTWTLVAASLALMMAFLDALVVTTALPTLRHSLHSSLGNLEWTVNAYNLALACMLLTGAALGDRFGRRRMFVIGVSVFIAASVLAGSASSVDVLITARAL